MFKKILIPIDLTHVDRLERAIAAGAYLAKSGNIPVVFTAVTSALPGPHGHTPEEFRAKLDAFASGQADKHGITASAHAAFAHDPAVELEDALLKAIHETGADLVVMATHVPNLSDYVWPSNGGRVASHSDVSVFLIR